MAQENAPDTVRRVVYGRLAYYRAAADRGFWDRHWEESVKPGSYSGARQGFLGWLEGPFTAHLPREGRILEAGCGSAVNVVALQARGYGVEGVEWSEKTVEAVKKLFPGLPVRHGDVTALDVPDGHYAGYISLGVVEHREDGPGPYFSEAYRVLKPGGVALFSVPYFNGLRRLKARLGFFRDEPGGREFYQYAFSKGELESLLTGAGFTVNGFAAYDCLKGLRDEIPLVGSLLRMKRAGWRLERWLVNSRYMETRFGHMLLAVCEKRG